MLRQRGEEARAAAFANTFGGVILIGAKAEKGILEHPGIALDFAAKLTEVYEQVAKDQCFPPPIVNAIIITILTSPNVLLAVNVDPTIDGPVGSRAEKGQDAWVFPVREVGAQARRDELAANQGCGTTDAGTEREPMNWQLFFSTFVAIFVAEMGDKTQIATLSLAGSATSSRLTVFAGSALALVATSAVAVLAGDLVSRYVPPIWLKRSAGAVFIVLGVLYLWESRPTGGAA